jgi:hypothetical protein
LVVASAGLLAFLASSAGHAAADPSGAPALGPTPSPTPAVVSGNFRDVAVAACMNEAKAQGAKKGATDVMLREVEDTDKKSDSRGAVRAIVNVMTTDKNGKTKKMKKTFKCETQNGQVTAFKYY